MGKRQRQKFIDACAAFCGGREATCPKCGSQNFKLACVKLKANNRSGFGAFWCEDCRTALWLCCADLTSKEMRQQIVTDLPDDLKYI